HARLLRQDDEAVVEDGARRPKTPGCLRPQVGRLKVHAPRSHDRQTSDVGLSGSNLPTVRLDSASVAPAAAATCSTVTAAMRAGSALNSSTLPIVSKYPS